LIDKTRKERMEVPVDELGEDYPELELEDVQAALMYATFSLIKKTLDIFI